MTTRFRGFALLLLFTAATGRPATANPPAAEPSAPISSAASLSSSVDPNLPIFKLGDAARPFGWATVVSDFNTDGQPDVAVADHLGGRTTAYRYRLRLSISGSPTRDVTFESDSDAVTLSVADVDRDNDADLIVSVPVSGETVGIWLNDGEGHFTAGRDMRGFPALQPVAVQVGAGAVEENAAIDDSPRAGNAATDSALRGPPDDSRRQPVPVRLHVGRSQIPLAQSAPRGPPSVSSAVSS